MIIFLFVLGIVLPAQAQLSDLMGAMAVNGAMTAQTAKGYTLANDMLKKNRLAEELQAKNIDLQTRLLNGKKRVTHEALSVARYPGFAQVESEGGFSITLRNIEKALCEGLDPQFGGAKKIQKNKNNKCYDKNIVKFYY